MFSAHLARKTIRISIVCLCSLILCAPGALAAAAFTEDKDGESALDLEDYTRAESIYRNRLSAKPKGLQEAYLRIGLGESLLWLGRFSEASKELKRAYSLMNKDKTSGELQPRVLDDLSWLSEAQSDKDGAISYGKEALTAMQALPNPDPVHTCEILDHLGVLTTEKGLYQEAAKYYGLALDIPKAHRVLQSADEMEALGMLMCKSGHCDKGKELYTQGLQTKISAHAATSAYAPHPYSDTVTYRYFSEAPNCGLKYDKDCAIETITAEGVTVAASINPYAKDLQKMSAVWVGLSNDSPNAVQLLPKPPSLIVLAPKVVICHLVDVNAAAEKIQKKGESKAKWVRFWGKDATQPVTTTFIGNPGVWGYPPITTYNYQQPFISRSGNMTTMTTQVPDYAAQARAMEKAAMLEQQARTKAGELLESALNPATVAPGQNTSGTLVFDTPNAQTAMVQIPVGKAVFEFKFPPKQ